MAPSGDIARTVRVLIVDDTRAIRSMIRVLLSRGPGIEVVGEAGDPYEARDMIKALDPDVLTLDVEMPKMNGLQFLEHLMRLHPMPVVMVSSRTAENSDAAIRALSLGAVECVDLAKLVKGGYQRASLVDAVLMAAASRPRLHRERTPSEVLCPEPNFSWNGKLVVIGSSTGGVDALLTVLSDFPADCPPTVIAQHMPSSFLESFTARLDRQSKPNVVLAEDRMQIGPGMVCVAPGGAFHAALSPRDPSCVLLIPSDGTELYVPSVNALFS